MTLLPGCESCPFKGRPETCHALAAGVARYCALIAGGRADYRELVIRKTEADPEGRATAADRPPPSFPPLAAQAANLAKAAARFVASGMERTTEEERDRRLAICRGCENFADGRCRLCGCSLPHKVAMASEHCPLDPPKW